MRGTQRKKYRRRKRNGSDFWICLVNERNEMGRRNGIFIYISHFLVVVLCVVLSAAASNTESLVSE